MNFGNKNETFRTQNDLGNGFAVDDGDINELGTENTNLVSPSVGDHDCAVYEGGDGNFVVVGNVNGNWGVEAQCCERPVVCEDGGDNQYCTMASTTVTEAHESGPRQHMVCARCADYLVGQYACVTR